MRQTAHCHPDRLHIARGLCGACYARTRRHSKLPIYKGGPCKGHPCDDCQKCVKGICCRRDNLTYKLPELGSIAPFFGSLGIIATDGVKIECHLCGSWFRRLVQHLYWNHDVTVAEYKSAFGLGRMTPLASGASIDITRDQAIARGGNTDTLLTYRPTPEQQSAWASRPSRLEILNRCRPGRRSTIERVRPGDYAHHPGNTLICAVCDSRFSVPPSAVTRGRKTCGTEVCVLWWRLAHDRRPGNAKLTYATAFRIRKRLGEGISQRVVAGEFEVSQSLVSAVHQNLIWGVSTVNKSQIVATSGLLRLLRNRIRARGANGPRDGRFYSEADLATMGQLPPDIEDAVQQCERSGCRGAREVSLRILGGL
jgi:hypothetical protein